MQETKMIKDAEEKFRQVKVCELDLIDGVCDNCIEITTLKNVYGDTKIRIIDGVLFKQLTENSFLGELVPVCVFHRQLASGVKHPQFKQAPAILATQTSMFSQSDKNA